MDFSFYVQDDFRVSNRLTINLGLRYELPLPTIASNYAVAKYIPGAQSVVYPTAPPGLLFLGDPGVTRSGTSTATNCLEPRVGLSYALTSDQKTVIRAGYGVYHNPNWSNEAGQFAIYQPFTRRITINAPPSTSNPWANYPGGTRFPSEASLDQLGYSRGMNVPFDQDITEFTYGPNFKELTMPVEYQRPAGVGAELAAYCRIRRQPYHTYSVLQTSIFRSTYPGNRRSQTRTRGDRFTPRTEGFWSFRQ